MNAPLHDERWQVSRLFWDWIPRPLPSDERRDGDFLLLAGRLQPEVVYLNERAAFVWHCCDGAAAVGDIARRYMVEYLRSDRAGAAWEVLLVLRQLDRRLVLSLEPAAASS